MKLANFVFFKNSSKQPSLSKVPLDCIIELYKLAYTLPVDSPKIEFSK